MKKLWWLKNRVVNINALVFYILEKNFKEFEELNNSINSQLYMEVKQI